MAYSTINKPQDHFNTLLYTGDGTSSQPQTGVGFQPDWTWIKTRSTTGGHQIFDVIRGATKVLSSNTTDAESTNADSLKSFDSDGFTLGGSGGTSFNGRTYASWNWLADGSASSNTDGSITSSVSANTTSGFSIVTWTGNATDSTIGHGLSSAPEFIIVKNRTDLGNDWRIAQTVTASNNMTDGNGYYFDWNDTKASTNPGSAVLWGATPTAPTSSVFTVGTNNGINGSGDDMLAYCFHSVKGYSKIGEYKGNGSTNGPFVYTGFKPAWLMVKVASGTTGRWYVFDNTRSVDNAVDKFLSVDSTNAESTSDTLDFCSNGFKFRSSNAAWNGAGNGHIYMAFAERSLVGTNGVPALAR